MKFRKIRNICDESKGNNVRIIGIPEEQEGKCNEGATVKEIIKNFPELRIIETKRPGGSWRKKDPSRNTPKHTVLKMENSKDRILKATRLVLEERSPNIRCWYGHVLINVNSRFDSTVVAFVYI